MTAKWLRAPSSCGITSNADDGGDLQIEAGAIRDIIHVLTGLFPKCQSCGYPTLVGHCQNAKCEFWAAANMRGPEQEQAIDVMVALRDGLSGTYEPYCECGHGPRPAKSPHNG